MSQLTIDHFRKEYIWGFTQGNPIKHTSDKEAFSKLISLISNTGTISIGASFHPYHLLDGKGNDLWEIFFRAAQNNESVDLQNMITTKSFYHINPPSAEYFPIVKWDDERLSIEQNPEFGKFVPFVIPFISYNDQKDPVWLSKIQNELKEKYNAKDFLEEVNQTSRFFLSEPTFILGFDEFKKDNTSLLIDHFIKFLENVIKQ